MLGVGVAVGFSQRGAIGPTYETPAYVTGDRRGSITITASSQNIFNWIGAPVNGEGVLVDGAQADVYYMLNAVPVAGEWLQWDFGAAKKFDKIKFYFSAVLNAGSWKVQGYINNAWVDSTTIASIGSSATHEITIDLTGATKVRILGVSGNSSYNAYWREVEFSMGSLL